MEEKTNKIESVIAAIPEITDDMGRSKYSLASTVREGVRVTISMEDDLWQVGMSGKGNLPIDDFARIVSTARTDEEASIRRVLEQALSSDSLKRIPPNPFEFHLMPKFRDGDMELSFEMCRGVDTPYYCFAYLRKDNVEFDMKTVGRSVYQAAVIMAGVFGIKVNEQEDTTNGHEE